MRRALPTASRRQGGRTQADTPPKTEIFFIIPAGMIKFFTVSCVEKHRKNCKTLIKQPIYKIFSLCYNFHKLKIKIL